MGARSDFEFPLEAALELDTLYERLCAALPALVRFFVRANDIALRGLDTSLAAIGAERVGAHGERERRCDEHFVHGAVRVVVVERDGVFHRSLVCAVTSHAWNSKGAAEAVTAVSFSTHRDERAGVEALLSDALGRADRRTTPRTVGPAGTP